MRVCGCCARARARTRVCPCVRARACVCALGDVTYAPGPQAAAWAMPHSTAASAARSSAPAGLRGASHGASHLQSRPVASPPLPSRRGSSRPSTKSRLVTARHVPFRSRRFESRRIRGALPVPCAPHAALSRTGPLGPTVPESRRIWPWANKVRAQNRGQGARARRRACAGPGAEQTRHGIGKLDTESANSARNRHSDSALSAHAERGMRVAPRPGMRVRLRALAPQAQAR